MKIATTVQQEEVIVAVSEHKEVEFLYTADKYDYFTIDGKWVRISSTGKCIHGVKY